ncbi:oxygenase MpaB family protein [Nocardioides ferulae]|uniref:oxygenase MpaB family protein n=1 Tax=Nocardioides ferulae TaxID=2340821 RepID=UPI0019808DE1|nr:oxygenase MpaB family protein [Nocardioides ferulae]
MSQPAPPVSPVDARPPARPGAGAGSPDPRDAAFGLDHFVGEQLLMLGAGSTVMYQLAMKGVGLGVAEHSTTLQRPVDRLRTTLTYVFVMTLGSEEERRTVARLVNRAHAPVRSQGRYSAFDPDLQLWVAATLARNGETLYERVWGRMDDATRERVYRDAWVFGTALQVRPEMWPQTRAEFETYWEESLLRLEADPQVQCYAKQLLSTSGSPWLLRPLIPLQSLMTRGNLDPRTRGLLALPWSRRDQLLYDLFWRVFPPVYRLVPRPLRHAHARLVLRDMRRRLRRGQRVI